MITTTVKSNAKVIKRGTVTSTFHYNRKYPGDGVISGTIREVGQPTGDIIVQLFDSETGVKLHETLSNVDGRYAFFNIDPSRLYDVIAFDAQGQWEKLISSRRSPVSHTKFNLRSYDGSSATVAFDGDPHWDNVVSLLDFENGFVDAKGFDWTNSALTIDDSTYKYGTSSLSCGSGNATVSNTVLGLTDSDPITIEFWLSVLPSTTDAVVFQMGANNDLSTGRTFGIRLQGSEGNEGRLIVYFGTSVVTVCTGHIPDFEYGDWNFITLQLGPRVSGQRTAKLFIDGNLVDNSTGTSLSSLATSDIFTLGQGFWTAVKRFNGHIDQFRMTKVERYTENFIPPSRPYPK